jgi:hypothetical protein
VAVTFSSLLTSVRRNLRDANGTTWTDEQLGELINQGIDAIGTIYGKEVIDTVSYTQPVLGAVYTVALTNVYWPIRVDIYNNDNKYVQTLKHSIGDGANSGWELHSGVLWLPPHYPFASNTGTLRVFGYGNWAPITIGVSSSTTDLDTRAQNAVKVFVEAEALSMLTFDRAQFQQWQAGSGNSDVTALGMNNLALAAQQRWRLEKQRIRSLKKSG